MKCRKNLVLAGYRVQYVDLREPKPRTPVETIHVVDNAWLDAMGLVGQSITENIRSCYERIGYKVFGAEPIKPKRVVAVDLHQLWDEAGVSVEAPPATEDGAEKEIA